MKTYGKQSLSFVLALIMLFGCFILPVGAVDQSPAGTTYTAEDPFHLSNQPNTAVKLEAEHLVIDSSGAASNAYARISESSSASGGKEMNWFNSGNVLTLHYDGAAAGAYTVELHYRTGRNNSNPNTVNWRGANITPGTKALDGDGNQNTRHTATFDILINASGSGALEFYADSHDGPVMDYMTFTLKPGSSLAAPAEVTVEPGVRNASVQINARVSWSAVQGASGYLVSVLEGAAGEEHVSEQNNTTRVAKISNLIPGRTYTVSVQAVDSQGQYSPSATKTFTAKAAVNAAATASAADPEAPAPYGALPDDAQLKYHKEELSAFIHFGPNTFNDVSWGTGNELPSDFMPTDLNQSTVDEWVTALKNAGFGRVIITGKHHDGFCIWDSAYTNHDVMGEGACGIDVLALLSDACTRIGMDMGFYMSPWDAHEPSYGYKDASGNAVSDKSLDVLDYNLYYENQLREVLGGNYGRNGKFVEVWMDGAKGTGAAAQDYDFDEWLSIIHDLQPDARVFGPRADGGIRWTGNELGIANDETSWQQMNVGGTGEDIDRLAGIPQGKQNSSGVMNGHLWSLNECDVSIRPEWFWHASQTSRPLEDLMNMYFQSVGRGSVLLLNVPPDTTGHFAADDTQRLQEFGNAIKNTFATDFAQDPGAAASTTQGTERASATAGKFSASKVIDGNDATYWTMPDGQTTGQITIELGQSRSFDIVSLQEYIELGQRVSGARVEYRRNGTWYPFGSETGNITTIGARRLIRTTPVVGDAVRLTITGALAVPLIRSIGVFKADPDAEAPGAMPAGLVYLDDQAQNGFTYSGTWDTYSNDGGLENTHKGTGNNGAYASVTLNTSKFYIMGILDPRHGDAKIYVDDQLMDTINTYSSARATKQVLYTSPDLEPGEHTLKFECITSPHTYFDFDGIYYVPADQVMVEFERDHYTLPMGGSVELTIHRMGPTDSAATFQVGDLPGTAVRGEDYNNFDATVTIPAGQRTTTITVTATDNNDAGIGQSFTADIRDPQGSLLLGLNRRAAITIVDPDAGQTPLGTTYTAADPFRLPAERGTTVRAEAEHLVLDSSSAASGQGIRVSTDSAASGGKKLGWFEENNRAILHYYAPTPGAYTVKMRYQSGRTESSSNGLNKMNFSGPRVETYSENVPGTLVNNNPAMSETTFPLIVREAGQGYILFHADEHGCPNIDWFEFSKAPDSVDPPTITSDPVYLTQIGAHISWTEVEGATGYQVSIAGNGATNAANLAAVNTTARTAKLVNLKPGLTYTVTVQATVPGNLTSATLSVTTKKASNAVADAARRDPEVPNPFGALPDDLQLSYHADEMAAFIHFGPNTFTGRSWGQGTDAEKEAFAPTNLDQAVVDSWVVQLQNAGFKRLIMVAKHHDGLCLWDSQYTDHDVMGSPFGQDLLEMVSIACTKYDMDMGFYFSPWDMHDSSYGQGTAYDDYYVNQLREVLGNPKYGNHGVFVETWMDGAHGSGVTQDYDFDRYFAVIHELQPQCLIYTDRADGGIRWSGNEIGKTGDPCWQTMNVGTNTLEDVVTPGSLMPNKTPKYPRMHGQEDGVIWSVCECDVSIETEWFWHAGNGLRSMDALMEMYFQSVGYGSPLLLNVPPNTTGAFADATSARLAQFGTAIRGSFYTDFALATAGAAASTTQGSERASDTPGRFSASNLIDGDDATYWTTLDGQTTGQVTIELGQARTFDIISIQEYIELGQRIKMGKVEYRDTEGNWHLFGTSAATQQGNGADTPAALHADPAGIFDTVGARRLVRDYPVTGTAIRVTITQSKDVPILRSVGVFKATRDAELPQEAPAGMVYVDDIDNAITYTGTWNQRSGTDYIGGVQKNVRAAGSATLTFTGTQAYVMGILDPGNGTFRIKADDGAWVTVDTSQTASRQTKMPLWCSGYLTPGEHTVVLEWVSGWVDFDGFCYVPEDKSVLDFSAPSYSVPSGGAITLTINRTGNLNKDLTFKVNDLPGTAVQGQYYDPVQEMVTLPAGETTTYITVYTKANVVASSFSLLLNDMNEDGIFGFFPEAMISITNPAQDQIPAAGATVSAQSVALVEHEQTRLTAALLPADTTDAAAVSVADPTVAAAALTDGVLAIGGMRAGATTVYLTVGKFIQPIQVTVTADTVRPMTPVLTFAEGSAQCAYTLTSPITGKVRVMLAAFNGARLKNCAVAEHTAAQDGTLTGTLQLPQYTGANVYYKIYLLGDDYAPLMLPLELAPQRS